MDQTTSPLQISPGVKIYFTRLYLLFGCRRYWYSWDGTSSPCSPPTSVAVVPTAGDCFATS